MKKLLEINNRVYNVTGVNDAIMRAYLKLFAEWYHDKKSSLAENIISAFTVLEVEINAQAKDEINVIMASDYIDNKYDDVPLVIKKYLVEE